MKYIHPDFCCFSESYHTLGERRIAVAETIIFGSVLLALLVLYVVLTRPRKSYTAAKPSRETKTTSVIFMLQDSYMVEGNQYNLLSYNQGEDWHVMLLQGKKKSVVGRLEDVHPMVLRDQEAWLALVEYVVRFGAIHLSDRKGSRLLRNCGFDVRRIYK